MPLAKLDVMEGYSDADKSRLGKAVTDAICFVVPASPDAVVVIIEEHSRANYMRGGQHREPAAALPDPKDIVLAYLEAMEQRDLATAGALLADGFEMHFPNTPAMTQLDELIAWAKPRYQQVHKTYSGIEAFQGVDCAVVFARGMLNGVWPDGSAFDGVRFIDRFEISDGKIRLQEVWNDMGEVRAAR